MSGSSSSYSNINSGISATAGSERTGGNSGCGSSSSSSSSNVANSNGGGGGGSTSSSNNNGNGSSGFDSWESRQHTQRERSSRAEHRTERTANSSDVLRSTGYGAAAIPSNSSRSLYLISSPSDSERSSHHQSNANVATTSGNAGSSTSDVIADRKDRSNRNDRSRDVAREERNRERECRNRSSTVNDVSEAFSSNAYIYNSNANSIAMAISSSIELESPESPGEYPDYLT